MRSQPRILIGYVQHQHKQATLIFEFISNIFFITTQEIIYEI